MSNIIPTTVSPEGLRARAEIMRDRGDESCAAHLEAAATEIAALRKPKGRRQTAHLDDPEFSVQSYGLSMNPRDKEIRVAFFAGSKQTELLGYMVLDAPDAYEFAMMVLADYDKLEGIT